MPIDVSTPIFAHPRYAPRVPPSMPRPVCEILPSCDHAVTAAPFRPRRPDPHNEETRHEGGFQMAGVGGLELPAA